MVKVSTRQELRTELQRRLKTRSNAIKRFSDQLFADFALTESSQYDWPALAAKAENSWEFVHFHGFVKGQTMPPREVVCLDEPDTYLLVAADKGTATFADIANELLIANGFWLGDAFASGGSVGHHHKAMGITTKGAWRSVQQHFRDKGLDVQSELFSVVDIGDMSGDGFGNGMLLSDKICLLGAFNHLHIFVDPDPDSKRSFRERRRLFNSPRSGRGDYKANLISKCGGVFSRSAKSISLTLEMRELLDPAQASSAAKMRF